MTDNTVDTSHRNDANQGPLRSNAQRYKGLYDMMQERSERRRLLGVERREQETMRKEVRDALFAETKERAQRQAEVGKDEFAVREQISGVKYLQLEKEQGLGGQVDTEA